MDCAAAQQKCKLNVDEQLFEGSFADASNARHD